MAKRKFTWELVTKCYNPSGQCKGKVHVESATRDGEVVVQCSKCHGIWNARFVRKFPPSALKIQKAFDKALNIKPPEQIIQKPDMPRPQREAI